MIDKGFRKRIAFSMYCPRCRAEYRDGFTICSDCGIALVPKLEPVDETRVEYVELTRTLNPADLAFIRSLLESEDIDFVVYDEYQPYVGAVVMPARVMVAGDDIERARTLLEEAEETAEE